jgi:hypothetical protein
MDTSPPAWYRPFAPRTVLDAAHTLASHVDFWEDEKQFWNARELSEFMESCAYGDIRQAPRFRTLLAQYIALSVDSARTLPGDEPFHRHRKQQVRDAIVEAKRWLDGDQLLPSPGFKRGRPCDSQWV